MNVAGFVLLAGILAAYVMLDGYDLGVGAIHLWYARTRAQRAASFAAIGPFWNGNEVMLIAAGAVLFALFPKAYAASFSGFYLPFIVLLWLLMVRGMSIELRGHIQSDLWDAFWDAAFSISSALLAFVLGVAIANVVRGVPLNGSGYFAGTFGSLLNGYALLVGVFALVAVSMHGAAFAAWRLTGDVAESARKVAGNLWCASVALFIAVTIFTLRVHPVPPKAALLAAPAIAAGSLILARWGRSPALRFSGTSAFLFSLLACAAQTLYPYLLPGLPLGSGGLTIYNSAPGGYSVSTAFVAAVIGIGGVLVYGTLAARRMLSRVQSR